MCRGRPCACPNRKNMIGYLEGKIIDKSEDRILLLCNQVGYEVILPAFVMATLEGKSSVNV